MIFADEQELYSAIKRVEKVPDWVVKGRDYHKVMKALMYGDDFKELLLQIQHIETEKKAEARKKYARPIKDLNAKILAPVSNVYSATGGTKKYNIESDVQRKAFLKSLGNIRGGYSLEKWLETYWSQDLYNVDPTGLMFLEWKDEDAYPTYKSINIIRDYKSNGQSIEYVIFEPKLDKKTDDKYWRVVDDEVDYTIKQSGEIFTVVTEDTIYGKTEKHAFGKCPGRVNSDKIKLGQEYRLAFIDNIKEAEGEYLSDRSILSMYKFLNGFSTPYRPKIICPECHGTKKKGIEACPYCDGKGVILDKDVTDEIILPINLDSEKQVSLPTNFAGFISPDLEIWDQYKKEAKRDSNDMFEVIWGTKETEEVKDQTAMGALLNTQPMTSKLNGISDVAQGHEWAFTEMLGNFYIESKDNNTRISVISYGRNYIIQPPEFLLKQYQDAGENKDPLTIRDIKLTEYLTSKYKNDPTTLRIELLKRDLEPYVHYDVVLVKDIYGPKEAQKKGLFTDWWETLHPKDLEKTKEQLEKERDTWMDEQIKKYEPAIVPPTNND